MATEDVTASSTAEDAVTFATAVEIQPHAVYTPEQAALALKRPVRWLLDNVGPEDFPHIRYGERRGIAFTGEHLLAIIARFEHFPQRWKKGSAA